MSAIEVQHNWTSDNWDWPLQSNDGVVKVLNSPEKWEVGLHAVYFTPKEIEVKVLDNNLSIYARHEERSDKYGTVKREVSRTYHLPHDVDVSTIRSHLSRHGILTITANKKHH